MKTAIYIEDGTVQLVLTAENQFETNALTMFREKPLSVKLFDGSFYDCRGGWVRQAQAYHPVFEREREDKSLILRIDESKPDVAQP